MQIGMHYRRRCAHAFEFRMLFRLATVGRCMLAQHLRSGNGPDREKSRGEIGRDKAVASMGGTSGTLCQPAAAWPGAHYIC